MQPHDRNRDGNVPAAPQETRAIDDLSTTPNATIRNTTDAQTIEDTGRVLATILKYDTATLSWVKRRTLRSHHLCHINNKIKEERPTVRVIPLRRGGTIKIYPNLVSADKTSRLKTELLKSGLFRQYKIQGVNDEPRVHFLLHEDATHDFHAEQPGYRYANITVKSRPLSRLPHLECLAQEMAKRCQLPKWTVGINPVLYRDAQDKMGDHADNDQGEDVILALLVDCSTTNTRRVRMKPFRKLCLQDGDEQIELFMEPGDAYEMDGEMQRFYTHSVPPQQNNSDGRNTRIAIVFRTGNEVMFAKDSGRACLDLSPKLRRTYTFGHAGLEEGKLYTRNQLFNMGAHLMQQRGISGNMAEGSDAIIVSGLREDKLGHDNFTNLMYAAESVKGARSVVTSHRQGLPIRIFRSATYRNPLRALQTKRGPCLYRYDGVYIVSLCIEPMEKKHQPYMFYLHRASPGDPISDNMIDNEDYMKHCQDLDSILDFDSRQFLHWWEEISCLSTEVDNEREALYALFGASKQVSFKSSNCKALAQGFILHGMEHVEAAFSLQIMQTPQPEFLYPNRRNNSHLRKYGDESMIHNCCSESEMRRPRLVVIKDAEIDPAVNLLAMKRAAVRPGLYLTRKKRRKCRLDPVEQPSGLGSRRRRINMPNDLIYGPNGCSVPTFESEDRVGAATRLARMKNSDQLVRGGTTTTPIRPSVPVPVTPDQEEPRIDQSCDSSSSSSDKSVTVIESSQVYAEIGLDQASQVYAEIGTSSSSQGVFAGYPKIISPPRSSPPVACYSFSGKVDPGVNPFPNLNPFGTSSCQTSRVHLLLMPSDYGEKLNPSDRQPANWNVMTLRSTKTYQQRQQTSRHCTP
jgi:alkylated DNA repair dioxygenase AlkB